MIKELCYKLKEKREELGYSIEYVVEKTKIHPSVIRDIEAGNLSSINSAYLKGFMRIYADFLGIKGTEQALQEIAPSPTPTASRKKIKKKEDIEFFGRFKIMMKKIPADIKKRIILAITGIILLLGIFGIGKFIIGKIQKAVKLRQKTDKEEQLTIPVQDQEKEELSVFLTVKKKCFLRVKVDGQILFEGLLNKGVIESWKGTKEIEFKISDGSAVQLEVNGKSISTLASIRKPIKSLKITPSGISVDK